jgi:hypothetical protein
LDLNTDGRPSVQVQTVQRAWTQPARTGNLHPVYSAGQITRLHSSDPSLTDWRVDLADGRAGLVRVPLAVYDAIEATDRDAYLREALADHLTFQQLPADVLLAGDHVVQL